MANSVSISVAQSAHDGYQTWTQRANANVVTNGGLVTPIIGPHLNGDWVHAAYFIFKFENVPRGSTIDNCKLQIRTNNAYSGPLTSRIYVAVENNLDPTGTGLVTQGQLGTMPWQRLGGQTAATTLYGNRCGPTHNKAGQTLSSYGAHVRDTSALIYKAFCTDQGNAAAAGRDLPVGSWVDTEDFAPALQPLVDDPGWNSTTQYIMVYLFADQSSGTTLNIGNLASFAWDNGTVGSSTAYGNAGGQMHYYDSSSGAYAPKLNLTYTSASLAAVNSYSTSSGNIRLNPARCLGRWYGVRPEFNAGNPFLPKMLAGSGDLPPTGMIAFNPYDPLWQNGNPVGARVKMEGRRAGRVDGTSLYLEDYLNWTPQVWWDIDTYQEDFSTRSIYSLRFYHRFDQEGWLDLNHHVVSFWLNGTESFRIYHRGKHFVFPDPVEEGELGIGWPGQAGVLWGTYEFKPPGGNGYYRYEVQVNENFNPKVRVRVYLNDSTTPLETLTANPTNVEMNRVVFGDTNTAGGIFHQRLADVEIWSDYLLDRQYPDGMSSTVGTPYIPQPWSWFEYDGSEIKVLEDLGSVASVDPDGSNVVMTTPSNALTYEDYEARMWPGDTAAYTLHPALHYGTGTKRTLDLYIPTGTPPPGGWPVIVYTHGGFWVAGSSASISPQFVTNCCIRGYAVASCNYVLSSLMIYGMGDVPAWNPNANTGRYPSYLINFKEAAHWLKTKASAVSGGDGTYDINASKVIASGHSAGGYNALAAAVSRDLTNDGGGRDLTLAGNVTLFGSPSVPDPEFLGVYTFGAPVNLNLLKAWDPTYPDWTVYGSGSGLMTATARMFLGKNAYDGDSNTNNTGVDEMISLNASRVPSICYAWGKSDLLVVNDSFTEFSQVNRLEQTINSVAGLLPATTTFENHEVPDALHHTIQDVDMDYQHFFRWLRDLPGI